jgi:hypothetical protein
VTEYGLACPLCSKFEDAQVACNRDPFGDFYDYHCIRCGNFRVTLWIANVLRVFPEEQGLRLSGLARLRTDAAGQQVVLTQETHERRAQEASIPTRAAGYFDRVIEQLAEMSGRPGRHAGPMHAAAMAARMFLPTKDFLVVIDQLRRAGLVHIREADQPRFVLGLTIDGWRRADELTRRGPRSNRAFVAMSFHPNMKPLYDDGIEPALLDAGYERPFRVDDLEHHAPEHADEYRPRIDDRIMAEIRRARFLVVDVTGARNAVYFEAGFAEGLGIPILWSCQEGHDADMCFDTKQIEHIIWKDPAHMTEQLAAKIARRGWRLQL